MIRCARCGAECDTKTFQWNTPEGLCNQCIEFFEWLSEENVSVNQEEMKRQVYVMTDPSKWEGRSVLPLVRNRGGEVEPGFLYLNATAAVRLMPTVYLGACLQIVEWNRSKKVVVDTLPHDKIMELTSLTYPTFASIIYDGWRIDT